MHRFDHYRGFAQTMIAHLIAVQQGKTDNVTNECSGKIKDRENCANSSFKMHTCKSTVNREQMLKHDMVAFTFKTNHIHR